MQPISPQINEDSLSETQVSGLENVWVLSLHTFGHICRITVVIENVPENKTEWPTKSQEEISYYIFSKAVKL